MTDLSHFLNVRLGEQIVAALSLPPGELGFRVAEIGAMQTIIELHTCPCLDPCGDCGACSGEHHADPTPSPCPTICALALPYADHEEYREEWRP